MNGQCFLPFVPGIEVRFQDYVSPPSTDHVVDDSPNLTLSDVRGVPLPAPSDKAPPPHIPHLRIIPHTPVTTSPQYTPSPSLPSHSSRRKSFTRSLPSYLEHGRPTHPQHGHCVIDGQGRSAMRHYRSASSSPYMNTAQLPYHDQAHPRHRDYSPYGPQVSPQPPLSSSSQDPRSTPPQLDAFALTSARYECAYCGKTFNRPSSLKTHTNTHTGEKRALYHRNQIFINLQRMHFSIHLPSLRVWSRIQCSE